MHLNGLPGNTVEVQTNAAQALLQNAGLDGSNPNLTPVIVVQQLGADGILLIQTSNDLTQDQLNHELQGLPGFDYTEAFDPNDDPDTRRSYFPISPFQEGDTGSSSSQGTGGDLTAASNPTLVNGFEGINAIQGGGLRPPDSDGAVGPSSFIEQINSALAVYNKTTGLPIAGGGITPLNTFYQSVVLAGAFTGDPVTVYNDITGKFGVGAEDFNNNYLYFAISKTSNPTLAQSDWNFFKYNLNDSLGGGGDYPKIGYNADGFVVSFNMFPSGFTHSDVLAIRNDGTTPGVKIVPGGFSTFTLAPASMHTSSAGGPMWFTLTPGASGNSSGNTIQTVRMDNVFSANPTFTFNTLNVNSYLGTGNPHQPGGLIIGNANLGTRMYFSGLRNVNGVTHLVAAHTVGDTNGYSRVRWYDINLSGATPTLIQQGQVNPGGNVDTLMPGIDINANGAIGLQYMQTSGTQFVSMYFTGRLSSDTAGTMQTPVLAKAGIGNLNPSDRIGDYSFTSIDPTDGSIWGINEYGGTTGSPNWHTWIAHWTLANPAGPYIISQTPTGTVFPPDTQIQVTFNTPVMVSGAHGFDPSKITSLVGPAPFSIAAVNAVNPVNGFASTFTIVFSDGGLTTAGNYSFHIGPDIEDAAGNMMDQDQDGPPPGQANDYYLATLTIDKPALIAATPTGTNKPVIPTVHVTFNEPILISSFDKTKITSFTRNGVHIVGDISTVVPTNAVGNTATQFDIVFATPEVFTGVYSMLIGPNITDPFGNPMASAFTESFNIDGPIVTGITPTGSLGGPVSSETVTFSRAMQVSTFTTGQVTLTAPGNMNVAVTPTPINPVGGLATQFVLSFAPQTAFGTYTTVIGPNIKDQYGNSMDQNGNFIPGETTDKFTSTFSIINPTIGPDAFGYTASLNPPTSFIELKGDNSAFTVITSSFFGTSVQVNLGANVFNFYGHVYTGANQLFVSSNGLISFGTPDSAYFNTNLTSSPFEPVMAPLWGIWTKDFSDPSGPMVLGKLDAVNNRLILEWNDIHWYWTNNGAGGPTVHLTFEVILNLNAQGTNTSPFTFIYKTMDNLPTGSYFGYGNTVGIKDQGFQGGNRLMVQYNNSSGYIVPGVSLTWTAPPFGATINGNVFSDLKHNGVKDASDPGLAGWTVYLDLKQDGQLDAGDPFVITDANGNYSLTNIIPGFYTLREVLKPGFVESLPPTPGSYAVSVVARQTVNNLNFGDYAVTADTLVGSSDWGFEQVGDGWVVVNSGYGGSSVSHSPLNVNLVVNPGFETGTFSGWTLSGNTGSTFVRSNLPHTGFYSAQLGPVGSDGFLTQTFATTPGHQYQFSFWEASDGGITNDFEASFNGVTLYSVTNEGSHGYVQHTFTVTATDTTSTIRFNFRNDPNYDYLDDVSVMDLAQANAATTSWFVSPQGGPGKYELYATWRAAGGNANNAQYKIYDGATLLATVIVNQQVAPTQAYVNGSYFARLGTFTTTTGVFVVSLSAAGATGTINADAVFAAAAPAGSIPDAGDPTTDGFQPAVIDLSSSSGTVVGAVSGTSDSLWKQFAWLLLQQPVDQLGLSVASDLSPVSNVDSVADLTALDQLYASGNLSVATFVSRYLSLGYTISHVNGLGDDPMDQLVQSLWNQLPSS
jgi:hypothetical protein